MSNERCATMILCRAGHRIAARMGRPVLHELWRTTRFSPAAAIFCRYLPQITGQDRTFEFGSWTAPGATRMRNRSACTEQKFFSAPREEVPCFAVGFILVDRFFSAGRDRAYDGRALTTLAQQHRRWDQIPDVFRNDVCREEVNLIERVIRLSLLMRDEGAGVSATGPRGSGLDLHS